MNELERMINRQIGKANALRSQAAAAWTRARQAEELHDAQQAANWRQIAADYEAQYKDTVKSFRAFLPLKTSPSAEDEAYLQAVKDGKIW